MHFISKSKTRVTLLGVLAIALASAVGAIAYWTTSGTGSASASIGNLSAATISAPASTTTSSVTITWGAQAAMTPSSQNSNITYTVERKLNSGAYATLASGGCSGSKSYGIASCTDTLPASPTTGIYTYRVIAHFGTSWTASSNEGAVTANLDTAAPATTITFPASGTSYNAVSWPSHCAGGLVTGICGTASDPNGVSNVKVAIRNGLGQYWNGSAFSGSTATFLTAVGTTSWSYAITPPEGSYAVLVQATDGVGNTTLSGSEMTATFVYDVTAPTVTINQAGGQADPSKNSPINFTVVFNESVTGFTNSDVTLAGSAGATTANVTGSGTTYNVAVSGMTGDGTVIATLTANVAADAAGNGNVASTSADNTVTYDTTAPTVTINQAAGQADPTSASPINFTVVFSETTINFATGDVTLTGSALPTTATVTGSGTTYNVAVAGMTAQGTVTATIGAGVATDAAGNNNTASTSTDNTVTRDTLAPSVTLTKINGNVVTFPLKTNATVTSIGGVCETAANNSAVGWTVSGDATQSGTATCISGAWTGTLTTGLSGDGNYSFAATQTDAASNPGVSGAKAVMVDKTKPVIASAAKNADLSTYVANTWTNQNVTVSFTCTETGTVQSGVATNTVAGGTLSAETSTGSFTNTGACTDAAGNNADPNTFSPIKIDKTKPAITATVKNADLSTYVANTWTNQNVTVSFACADTGTVQSGVATNTVAGGGTQSAETSTGSFSNTGTCTDSAGNNANSNTFSPIKVDKTVPVVSATAKNADLSTYVANTWTNQNVTVSFACADTGTVQSGVATNTVMGGGTQSAETSTGSFTSTGACADSAGNAASVPVSFGPIKLDKTAPTFTLATIAPATAGNTYGGGLVGLNLYFQRCPANNLGFAFVGTVSDALSGAASVAYPDPSSNRWTHAAQTVTTPTGGPYQSSDLLWDMGNGCGGSNSPGSPGSYVVTASDAAGNTATKTITFIDDGTAPVPSITHPVNGSTYSTASWNSACAGTICGTTTDATAGVNSNEVSIQRVSTGLYWNGSAFASATQVFQLATGTTSWSYAFPGSSFPADGSYTVAARSTDNAQNQSAQITRTFTIDATAPTVNSITRVTSPAFTKATSVQWTVTFSEAVTGGSTANFSLSPTVTGASLTSIAGTGTTRTITAATGTGDGTLQLNLSSVTGITDTAGNPLAATFAGNASPYTIDKTAPTLSSIAATNADGTIAVNDTLTFTYADTNGVDPASIFAAWDGTGTKTVNVTFTNNNAATGGNDSVTVANIGVVNLGSVAWWTGVTVTKTATLSMPSTNVFRITFTTSQLPNTPGTAVAASTFTWASTGSTAADVAGNSATGSAPGSSQRF